MGKRERERGKRGERLLCAELKAHGWRNARRGQQRAGVDMADVVDGPVGVHFECKFVERLRLTEALDQAARDSGSGEVPIVAWRRSQVAWVAILPLKAVLTLLARVEELELLA